MSNEPERLFSETGVMITEQRISMAQYNIAILSIALI